MKRDYDKIAKQFEHNYRNTMAPRPEASEVNMKIREDKIRNRDDLRKDS